MKILQPATTQKLQTYKNDCSHNTPTCVYNDACVRTKCNLTNIDSSRKIKWQGKVIPRTLFQFMKNIYKGNRKTC